MLRGTLFGLSLALLARNAQAQGSTAGPTPSCLAAPAFVRTVADSAPDLTGLWDFSIETPGALSTGLMALGHMDGAYAGALTPDATTTVVIRRLTVSPQDSVHMTVATREGDVTFVGSLRGTGGTLCGIVNYHNGARLPMIAHVRRRPRSN